MEPMIELLNRIPWFGWIAIISVTSGTVIQLMRLSHRHEERMEMIRQGRDPEALSEDQR